MSRRTVTTLFALLALAAIGINPAAAASRGAWGADRRLTNDPGQSLTTFNFARDVAADADGRVHVVWYDDRGGSFQVYTKRSLDRGGTWGGDLLLSTGFAEAEHPAIAAAGA